MKFSEPVRAPASEGLASYARKVRVRPVLVLINLIEAILSLLGVVVIILAVHYGSFTRAGQALDDSLGCIVHGLEHLACPVMASPKPDAMQQK
ncbi:hypothetical protein [Asticcacaulis sp. EMRT-3]|uniref:hypothetical protein n=1 Tax=Asticcacaulis sp. EMRT-3 TaxID=3040349 RepID=UPI0024AF41F9|nr:hypothetical protein [Asticcacaulis sp. EMRT-3]MDI7775932.1 hypothetical protein [Asticcacaulis sp. EMRT-3]